MRNVPFILMLCAALLVGDAVVSSGAVVAGSLEDFEDSQRRRSRRPPRSTPAPVIVAPPPLVVAPVVAPVAAMRPRPSSSYASNGSNASLAAEMILGDNPGALFSFGLSPWRDRVRLDPPATNNDGFVSPNGQGLIGYASSDSRRRNSASYVTSARPLLDPKVQPLPPEPPADGLKPGMAAYLGVTDTQGGGTTDASGGLGAGAASGADGATTPTDGYLQRMERPDVVANDASSPDRMRTFHVVARGGVSLNLDRESPARGFDSYLALESSYTPAFTCWWQTLRDQPNADTLHLAQLAYEPRWVTSQKMLMRPVIGASFLATEEGLLRAGALLGVGFEWFPVRPLYVELRTAGQLYVQGLANIDVFTALGVEILPTVFLYSSYRMVVNELSALSIASAGLRFDIGL